VRRRLPLRLLIPAVLLLAAAAWALAATQGLQRGTVYYYTPSELSARAAPGGVIRVGGQVRPGSVHWDAEAGVLRFMLADSKAAIPVVNRGAPPQLFRAGSGAVVEGRLAGGVLRSAQVIVKHDEEYRAPGERGGG
jgi:cytochrome c-type biogenesis protein CcmE